MWESYECITSLSRSLETALPDMLLLHCKQPERPGSGRLGAFSMSFAKKAVHQCCKQIALGLGFRRRFQSTRQMFQLTALRYYSLCRSLSTSLTCGAVPSYSAKLSRAWQVRSLAAALPAQLVIDLCKAGQRPVYTVSADVLNNLLGDVHLRQI